jgi:DNA polymerase-3 subunit alpha (Gram-positive type)
MGMKKTTGQHPGGLMIVPNNHSIYEFTPIQHPANDSKSKIITTHFYYHAICGKLLKLDLLGHDVPTIKHTLEQMTGIDSTKILLGDKNIIKIFTDTSILGNISCATGTLGLPEFGTHFVRQMLIETKPKSFAELVRISGLSHGTEVWFNNAQKLIRNHEAELKTVISTRDDIMLFLIKEGIHDKDAFRIMEKIRKCKSLSEEEEKMLRDKKIPNWYIESCKKIKYLFPKAHAAAYVMMAIRIAYFKIYYPYPFYAAIFSTKIEDFSYYMCKDKNEIVLNKKNLNDKDMNQKEKNIYSLLEIVEEFFERGLEFSEIDLYESDENRFKIRNNKLLPPLCIIDGLGESVARNIVCQREKSRFNTIEEFVERTKANKNVIALLKQHNIFKNLPETDQITLTDIFNLVDQKKQS